MELVLNIITYLHCDSLLQRQGYHYFSSRMSRLESPCIMPNKISVWLSEGFELNIQRNIDLSQ